MGFEALVQITLERGDAGTVASFEAAVVAAARRSGTQSAYSATRTTCCGSSRATSTAYATLRDQKLATLPGVLRLTSTIVMKRIIENRPLPLATRSG